MYVSKNSMKDNLVAKVKRLEANAVFCKSFVI